MLKKHYKETAVLYLTVVFILAWCFIMRFIDNGVMGLRSDEATSALFVSNHSPFTRAFWQACKSQVAGMPWSFIDYWAYLEILKRAVPFEHMMKHMEFYLRFPVTMLSLIAAIAGFFMVKRLSGSAILASIITVCVFTLSDVAAYSSNVIRFHGWGFSYSIISFCLLAYLLTSQTMSKTKQYVFLFSWAWFAIINGWSHIYSVYALIVQWFTFCIAGLGWAPRLSLPPVSKWAKRCVLTAVGFSGVMQIFFFINYMHNPVFRGAKEVASPYAFTESFNAIINTFDRLIFLPNMWLWLAAFLCFIVFAIKREKLAEGQKWKKWLMVGVSVGQLLVCAVFSFRMLSRNWSPESHYLLLGIVPFIFFFSYLAQYTFKSEWDKTKAVYIVSAALIGFYLFNPNVSMTFFHKTPGFNLTTRPSEWHDLRDEILALDAYGKVDYIFGAQPYWDHSVQMDVHGRGLDHLWQAYAGGPFSIAPITSYSRNFYGGRIGLDCSQASRYSEAKMGSSSAKSYGLDFCKKDKIRIRIVEK